MTYLHARFIRSHAVDPILFKQPVNLGSKMQEANSPRVADPASTSPHTPVCLPRHRSQPAVCDCRPRTGLTRALCHFRDQTWFELIWSSEHVNAPELLDHNPKQRRLLLAQLFQIPTPARSDPERPLSEPLERSVEVDSCVIRSYVNPYGRRRRAGGQSRLR